MKPGNELDALIAEKVMGEKDGQAHIEEYFFAPSHLISHAWEVVEKMEDFTFTLVKYSLDDEDAYHIGFLGEDGKNHISHGLRSAPHAICLAALKAKGVDIDTVRN